MVKISVPDLRDKEAEVKKIGFVLVMSFISIGVSCHDQTTITTSTSTIPKDSVKYTFTLEAVQRHDLNSAFMDLSISEVKHEQWTQIVADGVGRDVTNIRARRSSIPGGNAFFDIAAEVKSARGAELIREAFLSDNNRCGYNPERRRIECFLGWEPWVTRFEEQTNVSIESYTHWSACFSIMHPELDRETAERFPTKEVYTFNIVFCGADIVSQIGTTHETVYIMRAVHGVERLLVNFSETDFGKGVNINGLVVEKKAALAIYRALSDVRKSGFKCKSEHDSNECTLGNDWSTFKGKTDVPKLGNLLSPRTPVVDNDYNAWHGPEVSPSDTRSEDQNGQE